MLMRRFFAFLTIISTLTLQSCGVFGGLTAEEKAQKEAAVASAIADMNIYVSVNTIYPMSGNPIHSLGEYSLTIKDGKVTSHLPFRGTSRNAMYGTTDTGIKFKEYPIQPNVYRSPKKKDLTIIEFEAKSFEEMWSVTVEVWDNGNANITCTTRERTPMHYDGELAF